MDIGKPYLYKAVTKLYEGDIVKDEVTTTFGVRSIELKPNDGLYLNGRKIKIQGGVYAPRFRSAGRGSK